MRFELEGDDPIDNPTREQVDLGLQGLEPSDRTFAILARDDNSYIQTAVDDDGGTFVLEYQDGSLDRHYRAARPLPLQDVTRAFRSYLLGDGAWRSGYDWEQLDLS
jgi:hypothetical protein